MVFCDIFATDFCWFITMWQFNPYSSVPICGYIDAAITTIAFLVKLESVVLQETQFIKRFSFSTSLPFHTPVSATD